VNGNNDKRTAATKFLGDGMKKRFAIFACIILFSTGTSIAGFYEDVQGMSVSQLADRCGKPEGQDSLAFCRGLATGILNQLLSNGGYYRAAVLAPEARAALKFAGAVCGPVKPDLALDAFLSWAKLHSEAGKNNGLVGIATALAQSWPCD
jgi:hypothetical protein